MPHPERACSNLVGSSDGVRLLESILARVEA
jgi:phosphoribosylformylglycinamidine (FGAM) synthase-like amidotransferase family enzyme